jgi:hypothetical protein
VAFLIAVARTDLAFCNQPILVLVATAVLPARSRSALQVKFVGAAANLFFEIDGDNIGRFPVLANFLANFERTLHSVRRNRDSGSLAANEQATYAHPNSRYPAICDEGFIQI